MVRYLEIVTELTGGRKRIPDRIEIGSFSEFLKRIGKRSDGGRDIAMLKQAIERLATTGCISKRSYNCPADGGYQNRGKVFHLLSDWGFKGEPKPDGTIHETNWISLAEHVRKNLESGYISLIDVRFVRTLKGDITKQLYPFLSYRFWLALQHGRDSYRAHWEDLRDYLAASVGTNFPEQNKDSSKVCKSLRIPNMSTSLQIGMESFLSSARVTSSLTSYVTGWMQRSNISRGFTGNVLIIN